MEFKNTKMYKRGELGEKIIDQFILDKGKLIPYAPVLDGRHVFDRLVASKDKKTLMIIEIKTVDARKHYPDTGISISHFKEYLEIQNKYSIDVWIFFVDSEIKKIYGNTLKKLMEPIEISHRNKKLNYPITNPNFTAAGKEIIYFPLKNMVHIQDLTDEQCSELKSLNNKGYKEDIQWKDGYDEWLLSKASY